MFSFIHKEREQKQLFFQIDTEFKKCVEDKTIGIYAIYRDEVCLYVGQSKNMASRIATHLSGKYKECTSVIVYRSNEEESFCLDETEKFVMKELKPSENIQIDFSYEIDKSKIMESSILYRMDYCESENIEYDLKEMYDCVILNSRSDLLIMDSEIKADLYHFSNALDTLFDIIVSIKKYKCEIEK